MPVRRKVVIHGRVQGVGFRWAVARAAETRGVAGWAQNRADGTVEAAFEGEADAVERMVAWCRKGPSRAFVERVEVVDEEPVGDSGFQVR